MAYSWIKASLVTLLSLGASCAHRQDMRSGWAHAIDLEHESTATTKPRVRNTIVLITLDGARWQEIFQGEDPTFVKGPRRPARALMPNLHRLATERGALVGAPGHGAIRASGPNYISLPGYNEILSGRSPVHCQSNDCPPTSAPTLLDEAYAAGAKVAAFGSWERLDRALTVAPGRFPVSVGRAGDRSINPYPGTGDFRPDAITSYLALRYLWNEKPDVLFLGLGEPDEYAHLGNYDAYVRALSVADGVIGQLFTILDGMGEAGERAHVFITADHGRANEFRGHGGWAPESSRVWLFAAGPEIRPRGSVRSVDEHRLLDIAPTARVLLGLDADPSSNAGKPMAELIDLPGAESSASTHSERFSPP